MISGLHLGPENSTKRSASQNPRAFILVASHLIVMPALDSDSKVLIVGAGPGGLVLAQILRRYSVPFELYERDEGLGDRAQGWAVALIE